MQGGVPDDGSAPWSSDELVDRLIGASTGALRWSKPNSGPSTGFPQVNFINNYTNVSGHGERADELTTYMFPVIHGILAQLDGLASIADVCECLNKGAEGRS